MAVITDPITGLKQSVADDSIEALLFAKKEAEPSVVTGVPSTSGFPSDDPLPISDFIRNFPDSPQAIRFREQQEEERRRAADEAARIAEAEAIRVAEAERVKPMISEEQFIQEIKTITEPMPQPISPKIPPTPPKIISPIEAKKIIKEQKPTVVTPVAPITAPSLIATGVQKTVKKQILEAQKAQARVEQLVQPSLKAPTTPTERAVETAKGAAQKFLGLPEPVRISKGPVIAGPSPSFKVGQLTGEAARTAVEAEVGGRLISKIIVPKVTPIAAETRLVTRTVKGQPVGQTQLFKTVGIGETETLLLKESLITKPKIQRVIEPIGVRGTGISKAGKTVQLTKTFGTEGLISREVGLFERGAAKIKVKPLPGVEALIPIKDVTKGSLIGVSGETQFVSRTITKKVGETPLGRLTKTAGETIIKLDSKKIRVPSITKTIELKPGRVVREIGFRPRPSTKTRLKPITKTITPDVRKLISKQVSEAVGPAKTVAKFTGAAIAVAPKVVKPSRIGSGVAKASKEIAKSFEGTGFKPVTRTKPRLRPARELIAPVRQRIPVKVTKPKPLVKPRVTPILKSRPVITPIPKSKPLMISKPKVKAIPRVKPVVIAKPAVRPSIKPLPAVKPAVRPRVMVRPIVKPRVKAIPRPSIVTPPRAPSRTPFKAPIFALPILPSVGRDIGRGIRFKKPAKIKPFRRFVPTPKEAFLGITKVGKTPKPGRLFAPFTRRPIFITPEQAKKRKKKKKKKRLR